MENVSEISPSNGNYCEYRLQYYCSLVTLILHKHLVLILTFTASANNTFLQVKVLL